MSQHEDNVVPFTLHKGRPPMSEAERLERYGDPHAGIILAALHQQQIMDELKKRPRTYVYYQDEVWFISISLLLIGFALGLLVP